MDVPSVQEDNQIGRNSSPKQPTSELKHEFDYKDICCVSADQKNETSENLGKESAETRVLDSISYSVEQLRPPEEATKSSCSEPLRPPPEDATLSSIKQIGLPAESVTREISSPQQTTSDLNHELGSESMKIDVLEQKQVIPLEIRKEECDHIGLERVGLPPDEVTRNSCREQPRPSVDFTILCSRAQLQFPFESAATNANFEKSGSPVDDVSNNRGLGQLEAIQEDATYITSKLGHEEKGEAAATNSNPEESAPPPDDVSRTRCCGQLEPMLEDATHDTSQLGHGEKGEDEATDYHPEESGLPPDDVSNSQGLEEWQPMQEDTSQSGHGERGDYAATNSSPEGLRPPPDYLSTNQGVGQMEPMQEDAVTSSNPQASGEPPDYVSKNQSLGQLEQMQEDATHPTSQLGHREKVEDAATNSNPEKLGPPPDDVSKNQRLGRIELMQEVATPNSSQLEHGENGEDIARNCNPEELGPPPGDISNNKGLGQLVAMQEDATHNTSQVRQGKKIEDAATDSNTEELGPPPDDVSKNQDLGQLEPLRDYATRNTHQLGDGEKGEDVATNSNIEESGPPPDDVSRNHGLGQLEQAQEYATHNTSQSRHGDKGTSVKPRKGKKKPRPLGSPKVLRSRSQEKSKVPEQSKNLAEDFANKEKKRKKQQQMKNVPIDEFLRIRRRLRYLLTRMKYEQNFIDAYSGEGWKGQSLEKIKPEKELQRAKSEIFRLKLKIRDLFQRLHVSCAEGRLPESLFDSEGEIDSEDIFCAKCGSKELLANNDIILCDGACERGFHQFCLEPPLLNEDIPPDDEGWLCPGCDCKVDCTELLNDSQGTNLSISDSWEKVFPEAAAAASGNNMGDISGLPSDDSEDDDYDPGGPELEEEMQGGESSSDESDFSSASDDLGALPINDQNAGLPSDDSEDDDYNPNSLDLDVKDKQESSSSDFTSDSEYFSAGSDDNRPSDEVQGHMPSNGERSKLGGTKRQTSSDELLSLLESGPGGGDSAPPSGKRHVERLDYKRLHDETYGNVSSDSSDEDYMDTAALKRRKTNNGKLASVSPNRKTQNIKPGDDTKDTKHNQKESERTSKRRTGKKLDDEATGDSPAKSHKGSSGPDSGGTSATRSAHGRLGEAVTQRLLKSFKENQYPGRVVKENLATELSITVKQVSKWFENARWSFNHSLHMESKLAESASRNGTQVNNQLRVPEPKIVTEDPANNGLEKSAGAQNSRTTKSRKRKVKSDNEKTERISSTEEMTQKQNVDDTTPKAQELRRSGRVQSKTTDSVS